VTSKACEPGPHEKQEKTMPHQFENPEATKVADETVSKEPDPKRIEHVAEEAAAKAAKTEEKYDKDHMIFSI
jgi:hypothetical protein